MAFALTRAGNWQGISAPTVEMSPLHRSLYRLCSFSSNLHASEIVTGSSINLMSANPIRNEQAFEEAALDHWRKLGEEIQTDVEEFNRQGGSASFSNPNSNEYRVNNSKSGLEVRIVADPEDHLAHYDFHRTNDNSAGAPEGGILSMRMGREGVEFYSSDQPLTPSEARSLLLDPVLKAPAA